MTQSFRLADSIAKNMGTAPAVDPWDARVATIKARYPAVTEGELAQMYAAHLDAVEAQAQRAAFQESVAMSVFKAHIALAGFTIVVLLLYWRLG